MVFAPMRDISPESHEPSSAPRRLDHVAASPGNGTRRLRWRAVVHVHDRDTIHTTWHLGDCTAPLNAANHCPEGQRLLGTVGDPEGHCLINGVCGRCAPGG